MTVLNSVQPDNLQPDNLQPGNVEPGNVEPGTQIWTTACSYHFLLPGRGVGVLLPDGAQAALFRLDDGALHAVGNIDPFSGAAVISRGLVGDRGGRPTVQSPLKKQTFALDNGACLDGPDVALPVYATRVTPDGEVQVGACKSPNVHGL